MQQEVEIQPEEVKRNRITLFDVKETLSDPAELARKKRFKKYFETPVNNVFFVLHKIFIIPALSYKVFFYLTIWLIWRKPQEKGKLYLAYFKFTKNETLVYIQTIFSCVAWILIFNL